MPHPAQADCIVVEFTLTQMYFIIMGDFCKQINGTAMGTGLALVMQMFLWGIGNTSIFGRINPWGTPFGGFGLEEFVAYCQANPFKIEITHVSESYKLVFLGF